MCLAIMLINDTSVNKWATLNFALTCYLIFCNFRNLTIWI
jgi:intracellular septation protein A